MNLYNQNVQIESFTYSEKSNTIEVVFREPSNLMHPTYPSQQSPDRVWKEVYIVKDGNIVLGDTIQGTHTPGYFVEGTIDFDNEINPPTPFDSSQSWVVTASGTLMNITGTEDSDNSLTISNTSTDTANGYPNGTAVSNTDN